MLGVKGERTQTAKLFAELEAICNDSWPEGILLTAISDGLEPSDLIPLKDCGKIGEIFLEADHGAKEDTMINGIMLFYND